jgi:hypothetical protein
MAIPTNSAAAVPTSRTLKVSAQSDRIPPAATNPVIARGVHVSAAIDTNNGQFAAIEDDRGYLIPWQWWDSTGRTWNAQRKSSWALFKVTRAGGLITYTPVTDFNPVAVETTASDNFIAAVNTKVGLGGSFVPDDFELPSDGTSLSRETLFGFIDSLSTLPAPYPASLQVWAGLVVTDANINPDDELFALPIFGPPKINGYYVPTLPVTPGAPIVLKRQGGGAAALLPAETDHPTAPAALDGAGRLLDIQSLAVRAAPSGAGVGQNWAEPADDDWTVTLLDRFSSALDPAARTMAVLDTAVRAFFASPDAVTLQHGPDAQDAALSALGTFVNAVHWSVFSLATDGATAITPPAAAAFGALVAGGKTSRTDTALSEAQGGLAALSDRDAYASNNYNSGIAPSDPPVSFSIVSRRRLEALTGLRFKPAPAPAPAQVSLEGEETYRSWLLEHWLLDQWPPGTAPPAPPVRPLSSGTRNILTARQRRWKQGDAVPPRSATEQSLLNLSVLDTGDKLSIPINVKPSRFPSELQLTFSFENFNAALPLVKLRADSASLTLSVDNASKSVAVKNLDNVDLALTIVRQDSQFQLTVSAQANGGTPAKPGTITSDAQTLSKVLAAARGSITLQPTLGAFDSVAVTLSSSTVDNLTVLRQRLGSTLTARALRAGQARAFAGIFLPAVLSGELSPNVQDPPGRIKYGYPKLVDIVFPAILTTATHTALKGVPSTLQPALRTLFTQIMDAAQADARARAGTLVPAAQSGGRLTPRAAPIVLPFDQPDQFPGNTDLWTRLAGVAVVVGRSKDGNFPDGDDWTKPGNFPDGNNWYSLSVANLYCTTDTTPTIIKTVDPVPLQVAEIGGMRQITVSYDERSLVGEMPSDAAHVPSPGSSPPATPRRLEAYLFDENARLPALTAGKAYFFFVSLVGFGGFLTPLLRDPTTPDPTRSRSGRSGQKFPIPLSDFQSQGVDGYIRKAVYLRTTAIGAPRLDLKLSTLPGIPAGLAPLAGELPIQPAPLTFVGGVPSIFYLDPSGTSGSLEFPSAASVAAQVDFVLPKRPPVGTTGTLAVLGLQNDEPLAPLVSVAIGAGDWPTQDGLGLRVTAGEAGVALWRGLPRDANAFPEDPLPFERIRLVSNSPITWRAFAVSLKIDIPGGGMIDVVPPVVSFGSAQRSASDPDPALQYAIDNPVPKLPSETSHHGRDVTVLDGINKPTGAVFKVRRPATDFGTWERWINWKIGDGSNDATTIREAISAVHRNLVKSSENRGANEDTTIDDPAVVAIVAELLEIFPDNSGTPLSSPVIIGPPLADLAAIINERGDPVSFSVSVGATASVSATGVVVKAGHIYEIRFYGAIPVNAQTLISDLVPEKRVARPVRQGLRRVNLGGDDYYLGAPLVRTIEVATADMPSIYDTDCLDIVRVDAPQGNAAHNLASIRLKYPAALSGVPAEFYRTLRYCDRAALMSQRWTWRGRPMPDDRPDLDETTPSPDVGYLLARTGDYSTFLTTALTAPGSAVLFFAAVPSWVARGMLVSDVTNPGAIPAGASVQSITDQTVVLTASATGAGVAVGDTIAFKFNPNLSGFRPFEETIFLGRADDDIRAIPERRLERAHARATADSPALFIEDLDDEGGSSWWRFGLRLRSRYEALAPQSASLVAFSHRKVAEDPSWHTLLVRDRPTGRLPKRPGLSLVVPLTESLMADGSVPPILAIFNEPFFDKAHIGDGIEAVVDLGRHPLPSGKQKYWPQFGPDPILTSAPHSGDAVPIRLDGPVGYSFDIGTPAPRISNSGLLISPIQPAPPGAQYAPWSLVSIRFRTLEAFELARVPRAELEAKAYLLATAIADPPNPDNYVIFAGTPYEGLVIDCQTISDGFGARVSIDNGGKAFVAVNVNRTPDKIVLKLESDLDQGKAWQCTMSTSAATTALLRLVVSQREKPQTGNDPYKPLCDVSVRLRLKQQEADGLVRMQENAWLSVACLQLLSTAQFSIAKPVAIRVEAKDPGGFHYAEVIPARLSSFTDPVWCQFAQDFSWFTVKPSQGTAMAVSVDNLLVKMVNVGTDATSAPARRARATSRPVRFQPELRLASEDGTWQGAQTLASVVAFTTTDKSRIQPGLAAVVTRYVTDAFNLHREEPIAIYEATPGDAPPGKPISFLLTWPKTAPAIAAGDGGRLRLMTFSRVTVVDSPHGTPYAQVKFPDDFFGDFDDPITMDPSDARARILGISKPLEWTA